MIQSVYGSFMVHLDNLNIVWQSEPVCLGEPVRTHIQFKFLFIE